MKLNKSAARALDLLTVLAESAEPMTLLEIECALKIPKSSTFELVYTLVDKGFIDQSEKRFSLGINAFRVGISYTRKLELVQVAKEILNELAKECRQTVFLAKYIGQQMVYVDKYAKYTELSSTCSIGSSKPLYCSALGKAILATKTDLEINTYFSESQIVKFTQYTIDNADDMKRALAIVRKQGYATENREGSNNMCCVASPIFDWNNQAIAAVSITFPAYEIPSKEWSHLGQLTQKAALDISYRVGYSGKRLF